MYVGADYRNGGRDTEWRQNASAVMMTMMTVMATLKESWRLWK